LEGNTCVSDFEMMSIKHAFTYAFVQTFKFVACEVHTRLVLFVLGFLGCYWRGGV